jgi:hypothetical protein
VRRYGGNVNGFEGTFVNSRSSLFSSNELRSSIMHGPFSSSDIVANIESGHMYSVGVGTGGDRRNEEG